MRLYEKHQIFSPKVNVNCALDISCEVQKKIMNGNANFIIDLMKNLKISSFTISSLAIQIVNYFFIGRSYLCYDRFIYCTAALVLACKIREYDHQRIKPIIMSYYNCALNKSFTSNSYDSTPSIMNDQLYQHIKSAICVAESRLLKTTGFELEMSLPFDFINTVMQNCQFQNENDRIHIFSATKIVAFDAFRSYAPLIFNPRIIAVAAFIVSCSQFDFMPSQTIKNKLKAKFGVDKMSEAEVHEHWLDELSTNFQTPIKSEDVKDCLYVMNELLYLNLNEQTSSSYSKTTDTTQVSTKNQCTPSLQMEEEGEQI